MKVLRYLLWLLFLSSVHATDMSFLIKGSGMELQLQLFIENLLSICEATKQRSHISGRKYLFMNPTLDQLHSLIDVIDETLRNIHSDYTTSRGQQEC